MGGLQGLEKLFARLPLCGDPASEVATSQKVAPQYCGKLLYSLSCLVKNQQPIQMAADRLGLFDTLLNILPYHSSPVVKKVLGILDTVLAQNPELPFLDTLAARQGAIGKDLITLVSGVTLRVGDGGNEGGDVDLA